MGKCEGGAGGGSGCDFWERRALSHQGRDIYFILQKSELPVRTLPSGPYSSVSHSFQCENAKSSTQLLLPCMYSNNAP